MNLSKLIYVSTIADAFKLSDIESILRVAERVNRERSISGMLFFSHHYFIQYLEGDEEDINLIYSRIRKDCRHTEIATIAKSAITERLFEHWSMAYLPPNKTLDKLYDSFFLLNSLPRTI